MNHISKTTGTLPFQISDLPKGVSVCKEGDVFLLHAEQDIKGVVVVRMEEQIDVNEINLKIIADKNSHLKVIIFQNLSDRTSLQLHITTKADESAHIDLIQFHLGGAEVSGSITQNADEQSIINTDLLCRTKGKQKYRLEVKNVYPRKNGRGKILAKGIALDKSHLTINGGISIEQKGGGTDTHLKQSSLLLSRDASIKSTPSLQIDTNDVKAGHGASVTNLNDELLFYLTSRGIDEETARKMLISGFVAEQLEKIKELPELKEEILQII